MVSCVFGYFENLLSVQEETRRNEGKKKNKQKTGVSLNSLSLKTSLEESALFIKDTHAVTPTQGLY